MSMSRHLKWLLWIVLFGALWGLNEILAEGAFEGANKAGVTVWLAAWAFLVLAVARAILNQPGSSVCIGALAALFRTVNTGPFICHILGIFLLGVGFDLAATLLMRREKARGPLRCVLTGVFGVYLGRALFALIITYIVRYEYWVAAGSGKVIDHIFSNGSLAALAAAITVPLGYWIGSNGKRIVENRPRWAYATATAAAVLLWTVGSFIA